MGDPACFLANTCLSCGRVRERNELDACPDCQTSSRPDETDRREENAVLEG